MVRISFATLERWYHGARKATDPVAALRRAVREDAGRFRTLSAALIQALEAQYRSHPGWTVQLHYDNLAALAGEQLALQHSNPLETSKNLGAAELLMPL